MRAEQEFVIHDMPRAQWEKLPLVFPDGGVHHYEGREWFRWCSEGASVTVWPDVEQPAAAPAPEPERTEVCGCPTPCAPEAEIRVDGERYCKDCAEPIRLATAADLAPVEQTPPDPTGRKCALCTGPLGSVFWWVDIDGAQKRICCACNKVRP
jgi:hypothetical protein